MDQSNVSNVTQEPASRGWNLFSFFTSSPHPAQNQAAHQSVQSPNGNTQQSPICSSSSLSMNMNEIGGAAAAARSDPNAAASGGVFRSSRIPRSVTNVTHLSSPGCFPVIECDPLQINERDLENNRLTIRGAEMELIWKNLNYRVENCCFPLQYYASLLPLVSRCKFPLPDQIRHKRHKTILRGVSGGVTSGQLMAIMGPSGAGKSTLLECLAGRRSTGISGDISVSKMSGLRIAFISQANHCHRQLTVMETLIYASRIKNCGREGNLVEQEDVESHADGGQGTDGLPSSPNVYSVDDANQYTMGDVMSETRPRGRWRYRANLNPHELTALKVANQLGLDSCLDVRLNRCSGGQQKRVAIAVELVSTPHILILDEPTSGLDSSSCFQCISLLADLAHNAADQMVIIASIHQPSARVLGLFDRLYVLAKGGVCIYNGHTASLLDYLKDCDLPCPVYHNPADFIIELASGDYGPEAILKLASARRQSDEAAANKQITSATPGGGETSSTSSASSTPLLVPISKMVQRNKKHPTLHHLWILLCRASLSTIRDPFFTTIRLAVHIGVALIVALLYGSEVGQEDGCAGSFAELAVRNFSTPKEMHAAQIEKESDINANVALMFFCLLFIVFASMMPMALAFPMEMGVFIREKTNHWYSVLSFYVAKVLADTPYAIFFPVIFITIVYFMTGQECDAWRFTMLLLIAILLASICQSIGLAIGALFVDSIDSAVFFAPLSSLPALLFSGFFVKISSMPTYMQPLAYASYFRFAFEGAMMTIYSYGRCDKYRIPKATSPLAAMFDPLEPGPDGGAGLASIVAAMNRENASHANTTLTTDPSIYTTTLQEATQEGNLTTGSPSSPIPSAYPFTADHSSYLDGDGGGDAMKTNRVIMGLGEVGTFDLTESKALSIFGIENEQLTHHLAILGLFCLIIRITAYLIFLHKSSLRN